MTVTIEVMKQETYNILRELENLGLIHVNPVSPQKTSDFVCEKQPPYLWLRGCCKNIPGGSVDDFLKRCREDKEYELAIEKRQEEERISRANAKLSP